MGCCNIELSFVNLVIIGVLYYFVKKAIEYYKTWKTQELLDKWNNTPKGKVILHGVPRGKNIPSISPYCLKLETYLRMAKIPYEFEAQDSFGPKGKSPWISYNGSHVADSHLIIQFLNKKFEKDLNSHLSPDQREICRAARVILENHFVFGLASWRWVENVSSIDEIMKFPMIFRTVFLRFQSKNVQKSLNAQGLGRHTISEINEMTTADLKTISILLGSKPFMGGQEPCEEDCAIFGQLAQALWAAPGSQYEKLVEGEKFPNLKQYCIRMKDKFWPDWTLCLDKTTDYYN